MSLITPLLLTLQPKEVRAQRVQTIPTQEMEISSQKLDPRAVILRDYFVKYNSPLQYHAQDFVDASDEYGVDWKLVPAIAGVESTFGENTPGGYNGWGWGVYGNQAIYFSSWHDAIFTVTKGIKENYISKGMTDPYSMNYSYAASPYWGGHVDYFIQDISAFAAKYPSTDVKVAAETSTIDKSTAGSSASLANKNNVSLGANKLAFNLK